MLKEALIMIAAVIAGNWLWKNQIFADWSIGEQIGLLIFLCIAYVILSGIYESFSIDSNCDIDIDNDIFIDNAPNPTPSPTNPPTSEQVEFAEFMKRQREREQERGKELIRRE